MKLEEFTFKKEINSAKIPSPDDIYKFIKKLRGLKENEKVLIDLIEAM